MLRASPLQADWSGVDVWLEDLPIPDLRWLEGTTELGVLKIDHTELVDLDGLQALESAWTLALEDNPSLTSLTGLEHAAPAPEARNPGRLSPTGVPGPLDPLPYLAPTSWDGSITSSQAVGGGTGVQVPTVGALWAVPQVGLVVAQPSQVRLGSNLALPQGPLDHLVPEQAADAVSAETRSR